MEWHILPTVSSPAVQRSLEEFAAFVGAGPEKRVLLVLDEAGFHKGRDPEGP